MPFAKHAPSLVFLSLIAGCVFNSPEPEPVKEGKRADFESFQTASCPEGAKFILPEKIAVTAEKLSWGEGAEEKFGSITPLAVYELTSDDVRLGGLSGVDFLDEDTLIFVTDAGDLVWMDIAPETGEPVGPTFLTVLRSSEGKPLDGKKLGDAEGLAWNGQYAFVSFERDHRILGYDIEGCGANAFGIEVIRFAEAEFGTGISVRENGGLEALASFGEGLIAGLETRVDDAAGLSYVHPDSTVSFNQSLPVPDLTLLVGVDVVELSDGSGRVYALTRSYDPVRGNQIGLVTAGLSATGELSDAEIILHFGKPLTVDNFEGIAVQRQADGTDRIFIVSDDNFSDRQRNLLGILEYKPVN